MSNTKVKKILCLFDYACNTGFGTVSKNIVLELKRHFGDNLRLDIFAINYYGEMYEEDANTRVCSAQGSDPMQDPFGRVGFLRELTTCTDYHGIFIIQDVNAMSANKNGGATTDLLRKIRQEKKKNGTQDFKSIFYFPVDCGLVDLNIIGMDFFDRLVTYNEFGRAAVLNHNADLKDKLFVVPHGNNPSDFYPIEDKQKIIDFRRKYFNEIIPFSRYIISNINRNQPRKDIPNTILGFIEAKENWPEGLPKPFLYLHMNPDDTEGWDLRLILQQTNLKEGKDYMLCPEKTKEQGATIEIMNNIYNASDLYLTTTTGEGWSLGLTEAMATKTPVLATNYSSIPEITNNGERGWLLETLYPHFNVVGSMRRYQTDFYEVGEKIIQVAKLAKENSPEYQNKIDAAYKYVQSLNWESVCKEWARHFNQVFGVQYK